MKIIYETVESYIECESFSHELNGAVRKSYGIALRIDGEIAAAAEDISGDRELVVGLTKIFNSDQLDPAHFEQAVEDFLTDLTLPE